MSQVFIPATSSNNTVQGDFQVINGDTTLGGNLLVKGSETVQGNFTVIGAVSAGSVQYSSLTVTGDSHVEGSEQVDGTLTVGAAISGGSTISGAGVISSTFIQAQSDAGITPAYIFGNSANIAPNQTGLWKDGSNRLALYGAGSGVVTTNASGTVTTTLDDKLGNLTAGGSVAASFNAIGKPNFVFTNGAALSPAGVTSMFQNGSSQIGMYASGGVVTTDSTGVTRNVVDNGSGAATVTGTLKVANSTITGSGSATAITMPSSSGILALTSQLPAGTAVTTTTINNNTLPASFTTLAVSGNETIGGVITVNNTAAVSNTNILNLLTPNLPANNAMAINMGVNGSANNSAFIVYTYRGTGATNNSIDIQLGNGNLFITASGQVISSNGTTQTTLDNGAGAATFPTTVAVGNSTLTGSAGATAIQLPASSGVLALTSQLATGNYWAGKITGGNLTVLNSNGSNIVVSGLFATLAVGTYSITYTATFSIPTASNGGPAVGYSGSGTQTDVEVSGSVYNAAATTQSFTSTASVLAKVTGAGAQYQFQQVGGTLGFNTVLITQLA